MNKSALKIGVILMSLISGLAVSSAQAIEDSIDNGEAVVNFYTSEKINSVTYRINYPGMSSHIVNGRIQGTSYSPDCLVLNDNYDNMNTKASKELLDQLEVRDGWDLSSAPTLTAKLYKGSYVYFLTSLGGYVTKLSVKTKDPSLTFSELKKKVLGKHGVNANIILSRGCSIVRAT